MPEISRFLGIVIGIFYNEHGVAHFHAVYGEHEISVEVESGKIHGQFPGKSLAARAGMGKPSPGRIDGELAACQARATAQEYQPAGVRMMNYHIVEARYVAGHVVWLRFRDGTSGEVDLAPALRGPIFEPLRNPAVFSQFQIHPEFHTLVWPNGADFAPEFLRDNVRVTV